MTAPQRAMHTFFYPKSVAVIGVSADESNLGRNIVRNLLLYGYRGEIFSVGLREGILFGQRIYSTVEQINRPVDLAVILTPARTIPAILRQCGRRGIRHAIIESGGFSEMGSEGLPLEKACLEAAAVHGIRFVGPNGIATMCMENGLALPFVPLRTDLRLGPVSVLSQSGGVGLSYLEFLAEEQIGLNKFVSMGNKLNVDENDLLEYLLEDEGTRIVLMYLEGFKDGRRFMEIASRFNKPILVLKSNRYASTARIAHSHTAALFADDRLVNQALEQAGCVRVNTIADALDYLKILTLPPLRGNRLAVISRSGGHAVIAADACGYYGFELPVFPADFLQKIERRFRAKVIHLQNPLDMGDLFELGLYEQIVEEMLKRKDVDGVLLGHGYHRGVEQGPSRTMLRKVAQLVPAYRKPVALVIFTEARERDYLKRNVGIPIFSAPENAMRAFHLSHRMASRRRSAPARTRFRDLDRAGAEELIARGRGRGYLLLDESMELIRRYGIPAAECRPADRPAAAVQAWRTLEGPVAMKLNQPHVSHKTDRGLIKLGLDSAAEIRHAFRKFKSAVSARRIEVLLQPMEVEGLEVILGAKRDEVFGPVILFGLGGIHVEALGDVSWRVIPIGRSDARGMVEQIRGRKILAGLRGQPPSDTRALEDLLLRLSRMMEDHPGILEIDINPVKVRERGRGARALDARVILGG